jgi:hypothetical protein
MSVQCWPEGHATRCPCEAEIPDTDFKTMARYGWGFVFARDDGSPTGEGAFYACPEHRTDYRTDDERDGARRLYAEAVAADGALEASRDVAGQGNGLSSPEAGVFREEG